MSKADIYTFERKVQYYQRRHGRTATRRNVISPMVRPEARPVAERLGIEICGSADEVPQSRRLPVRGLGVTCRLLASCAGSRACAGALNRWRAPTSGRIRILQPIRKGVMQRPPAGRAQRQLGVVEQAGVQALAHGAPVQLLADEDQLLPAVAIGAVEGRLDAGALCRVFRAILSGGGVLPPAGGAVAHQSARLRPAAREVMAGRQPEPALGAQQNARPVPMHGRVKALGVTMTAARRPSRLCRM
jgi:hypothetical protein